MRSIALLVSWLVSLSYPLAAQTGHDAPTPRAQAADTLFRHRDPLIAGLFGTVIPGAGHLYAGEYRRGLRLYGATVALTGAGALALSAAGLYDDDWRRWSMQRCGVMMLGIGLGHWAYSALDAPRAAARANRRHATAQAFVRPVLQMHTGPLGLTRMGAAISW